MISQKMYKVLNGFNKLEKKGIFIKKDHTNYREYKFLRLLNWSGIYDEEQYPFYENLKNENPDLFDYFYFEDNSQLVLLNEKAHLAIKKYKKERRKEISEIGSFIISIIALVISIIAITNSKGF